MKASSSSRRNGWAWGRNKLKVELFSLCDAATESGGKLNILGVFDSLGAREVPVNHPHCAIALRLRFSRIESGSHNIRVSIVDQDGRPVLPHFNENIEVRMLESEESSVANLILGFAPLRFDAFGRFSIDLAVDGRQECALPLYVRKVGPPQP